MIRILFRALWVTAVAMVPTMLRAQIDPVKRELLQLGYNGAFEGKSPFSGYAFLYWNDPDFFRTNFTLRLAIAPTYIDSEFGIRNALGENTDLGVGLAGGGFADSYSEIRRGQYLQAESFSGYGGEVNASIYHLFNPGQMIPLNGVMRGLVHYSAFDRDDKTDPAFRLPNNRGFAGVRTGLRWGGKEPILFPSLAMELSVWYEGQFRNDNDTYGYGDRRVEPHTHQFWAQALLAYTLPKLKHSFFVSLTAGTSVDADRFSAYRLGALLPLVSEFPLSLPGYYYQEISAREFVLLGGNYLVPIDEKERWNVNVTATTAAVNYIQGLEQPGHWHSGAGAGILYKTPSWKVMVGYAYGVDAIRDSGRGAHSIGFLLQLDWEQAKEVMLDPEGSYRWRGFQNVINAIGL